MKAYCCFFFRKQIISFIGLSHDSIEIFPTQTDKVLSSHFCMRECTLFVVTGAGKKGNNNSLSLY